VLMRSFLFTETQNSPAIDLGPGLLDAAFERVPDWTALLLGPFFRQSRKPCVSATAYARRRVRSGELLSARLDAVPIPHVSGPLATSRETPNPNFERLSYFALQRLSSPARPTTVYWPSSQFARTHGSWTGSDALPNPLQISHSLLCTAVWLHLLTETPDIALDAWTSERQLQFHARREGRGGPIPDALVERDAKTIAIEILGKYPANWIEHHVDQFETHFDAWELW
jgi:hypothetical protein